MLNMKSGIQTFLMTSTMTVLLATYTHAASIDAAKSMVTATGKQMGVPVTGKFKKIAGDVVFNAAQLAQSKARVDIDVGSYDMGMVD